MKTRAFSHLAIGVKDMEAALGFYRDLLGLKVDLDRIERGGTPDERRAVYLRWEDGPDSTFIVLGQTKNLIPGEPLKMNQLGYHHFAFWVEDLEETLEKAEGRRRSCALRTQYNGFRLVRRRRKHTGDDHGIPRPRRQFCAAGPAGKLGTTFWQRL